MLPKLGDGGSSRWFPARGGSHGAGSVPPLREALERALGADFSAVQIHVGSPRATEFGALAFTQGHDIHVAPGRWTPHTASGRRLLGHELGHVMQQREGRVRCNSSRLGFGLNDEPRLEREADAMGERAARALAAMPPTPASPWVPVLRPFAARVSPSAPIQRTPDPAVLDPAAEVDPPLPGINKPGFIDNDDGANIRSRPAELGGTKLTRTPLPPATRVFVSGRHPEAPEWWYVTTRLASTFLRGYVQDFRINTDVPEPGARLYQIAEGDTVEGLARREFSAHVTDGHDLRYYENVLLAVNRDKNRAGLRGSFQAPNILGGGANNIQLEAGRRIWLVSPAHALALKSEVPDGSLTNGLVAKGRRALGHMQDILQSVTDSPRYLGVVAGEYAEAITAHLPEIIGVTAAFIFAEAASAFLAATPTGVGQLAALLIQLILATLGAAAAVEAGVQALQHAEKWLTTAWTAGGDAKQIEAASKEFLKMLVTIAMAALAVTGVRGNLGRAAKIDSAITVRLPRLAMAESVSAGGTIGLGGPVLIPGSLTTTGPVMTRPTLMSAIGSGGGKSSAKAEAEAAAAKKRAEAEAAANKVAESADIERILRRAPDADEAALFKGRKVREIEEMVRLIGTWAKRTYDSPAHSVRDHAGRKRFDPLKYLRKAAEFKRKGAHKTGPKEGGDVVKYERPDGEFLEVEASTGKIVTYGFNPR
ncbi:DUF4157 domain-containing protein [Nannocystis sp. RBIL2]|uniref:eCIS core domain-containing protein n=1 Tax=Nannocystis sp. RBIL2 TaxID=2996788 RepID=UPI002270B008|nr:DUF4157 domain-containing protein [Nannocystis sp. RBIL2]MCY1069787.1 DUF4157 domain-containing protein [Nannocystis sp. RBIL2]